MDAKLRLLGRRMSTFMQISSSDLHELKTTAIEADAASKALGVG